MRACDDCPNNASCAGTNLHPVLVRVYGLYAGGVTDKFDILDALGDDAETLLMRFNDRLAATCWSKAALLAIAEEIARLLDGAADGGTEDDVRAAMVMARDAFERFPWRLSELVEQAPDLYQAILDIVGRADGGPISKRAFVKICKEVAYGGV